MASSPAKERRSRGQHSRSGALTSSTSSVTAPTSPPLSSSATPMLLPTTTTINAQGSSSKNPLLQQDVTASDLFTHYTPNEISQHLSNLKVKLSTYDSELKALINNRYEDILSVGNTISAMKGSAIHLTEALQSIGNGMRGQGPDSSIASRDGEGSSDRQGRSQEEEMQIQSQAKVKHIAALLLILQEAPEEIWRLLETSSQQQTSIATTSSKPSIEILFLQCKATLKSARSLSLAASILHVLKHAGKEVDSLPRDVKSLFPHPLSNHANTVASIETEVKSNLTHLVAYSSIALASDKLDVSSSREILQPCLEATLRTCILSLSSLIQLGHLSLSEGPLFFLQQRRKTLEQWCSIENSHRKTESRHLGSHLQLLYQEVAEVLILYQQMFSVDGGALKTVVDGFVAEEEGLSTDTTAGEQVKSKEDKLKSLSPLSSLAALKSLPSSEHTLCSLAGSGGLKKALQDSARSMQGNIDVSSDTLSGSYIDPVHKSICGQWAPVLLQRVSKNKDIGRAKRDLSRASKQMHKIVHRILSQRSEGVTATDTCLSNLLEGLQGKLDSHATENWKQEITQWRSECKKVFMQSLDKNNSFKTTDVFHQLLLPFDAAAHDSTTRLGMQDMLGKQKGKERTAGAKDDNATALDKILHGYGPSSPLSECFKVLESGWTRIRSSKEDYFAYSSDDGNDENLRVRWTEAESQSGWSGLFDDLQSMLDDCRSSSTASGVQDQDRYDGVLQLSQAIRLLTTLPQLTSMVKSSFQGRDAEYDAKRNQLVQSRKDALELWRADVIVKAQSLTWQEGQQGHIIDSLVLLHQQSYSVVGLDVVPHLDGSSPLLRIGSFVDLIEGFITQLQKDDQLARLSEVDTTLLRYILSNASTSPSSNVLHLLGDTGRQDDASVTRLLRPYRLLFGHKISDDDDDDQMVPPKMSPATSAEPIPPFALATNSRRLRGIQVG